LFEACREKLLYDRFIVDYEDKAIFPCIGRRAAGFLG